MSEAFIAEIRTFSFGFAPKGWAMCNGQTLPINQNQALFSLIGTTYGGNGTTTFALPNLQGSVPAHVGGGLMLGGKGGEQNVTLTVGQLPAHSHPAVASSNPASLGDPGNAYWAQAANPGYATAPDVSMYPMAIAPVGGGQPHNNMSPFLALNFCIALVGIYPTRN